MLYSGTDPESYITEYTLVFEDNPTERDLWVRLTWRLFASSRTPRPSSRREPLGFRVAFRDQVLNQMHRVVGRHQALPGTNKRENLY